MPSMDKNTATVPTSTTDLYPLYPDGPDVDSPFEFQNFLNDINTSSPQNARIQEFINKNPKLVEKIFNSSVGLGSKVLEAQEKLTDINNKIYQNSARTIENLKTKYQNSNLIPGFIANSLGLNNPLVKEGGLIQGGTKLNPQAITFLQEQKNLGSVLDRNYLDAMGGNVEISYSPKRSPKLDIAFKGPSGYADPSAMKKRKSNAIKRINELEAQLKSDSGTSVFSNYLHAELKHEQKLFKDASDALLDYQKIMEANPLTSEAIRYQLGSVMAAAPEGTTFTASPIGGREGSRARLYKGMSEGALETVPALPRIDFNRLPTNEEFRLAYAGGGFSPSEYQDLRTLYSDRVKTLKTGPQQFQTWNKQTINWNPEELKDPLIRAAFNLNENVDVSSLRKDPTNIFFKYSSI